MVGTSVERTSIRAQPSGVSVARAWKNPADRPGVDWTIRRPPDAEGLVGRLFNPDDIDRAFSAGPDTAPLAAEFPQLFRRKG